MPQEMPVSRHADYGNRRLPQGAWNSAVLKGQGEELRPPVAGKSRSKGIPSVLRSDRNRAAVIEDDANPFLDMPTQVLRRKCRRDRPKEMRPRHSVVLRNFRP